MGCLKKERKKRMKGMSEIVRTISKLSSGLIFFYGIYIVLLGHLTPGGGFAGGVIISGAFILLIVANGIDEKKILREKERAGLMETLGIFLFWIIAVIGTCTGTFFFLNFLGKGKPFNMFSAGTVPLCNIGIGIEVSAAICSIVIAFILVKKGEKK
jgi:multisubunit Na+/H+ antiporter MnhB subunit